MVSAKNPRTPEQRSTAGRAARRDAEPVAWVADDDSDMRDLVAARLRRCGFHVIEFDDGNQLANALWAVIEIGGHYEAPAFVVSDVRMPGLGGFEVAELIRRSGWTTPVILMTAFPEHGVFDEARKRGALAVLAKPFDVRVLDHITRGFR